MKPEIFDPPHHRCCVALTKAIVVIAVWFVPLQFSFAQGGQNSDTERNFSLQEGRGVAVCEAYLELLNKTKFEVTPFCGRPTEGPVKGFEHLDGHFMKEEEIWPLFTKVWEFMRFGDQNHNERFFYPSAVSPQLNYWSTDATAREVIASFLYSGAMSVWVFSAPIDINNDGAPLNVVTWQGYGATGTGAKCGSYLSTTSWSDVYVSQRAFVLTADVKSIDENRTRVIFGAQPGTARPADSQAPGGTVKRGPNAFISLADSIGILKFDGRYYIETEDRPKSENADLPPVRVILREHGNARQICSLHPESVPKPME